MSPNLRVITKSFIRMKWLTQLVAFQRVVLSWLHIAESQIINKYNKAKITIHVGEWQKIKNGTDWQYRLKTVDSGIWKCTLCQTSNRHFQVRIASLLSQRPRNDVLTTCKAVTLCGGQRTIAKNLFWSQTICDPPQDFNAKGESTRTTRLQFAILHH